MIVTLDSRLTIRLPAELRDLLEIRVGDPLDLEIQDGALIVRPVAVVPRQLRLSKIGEEKESLAAAEVAAGHTKSFATAHELLGDLHEDRQN